MRRLGWMTALEARGVSLTAMTRADRLCSVEKTKPETVRSALLVVTCLEVLHAADRPLSPAEVLAAVGDRIGEFTDHENELHPRGHRRWELALRWLTGHMTTIGWMSKTGGWQITDSGVEALETYQDPGELLRALMTLREQVYEARRHAAERLAPVERKIVAALGEVTPGQWTSYRDLAELVGSDTETVADFLAKERVPNAARVLREDGTPPSAGMLNQWLRGGDLRKRLAKEGVEFDALGRASQAQRVTAQELRERLAELKQPDDVAPLPSAWLVRGSVDGSSLVSDWLDGNFVSLAALRLSPAILTTTSREATEDVVREAYNFKTYAQLERMVREVDAFLRLMKVGDYVTLDGGQLYLGEITGDPVFVDESDGRSNLRRWVRWYNPDAPIDYDELDRHFVSLLSDQSSVVNLTDALDLIEKLAGRPGERATVTKPEARLADVTEKLARQLYLHDVSWLRDVADLLADKRQIILYGPPGTGKTYLATRLARHLVGSDQAVKLVQFHPSYTYEDFFEGYRPTTANDGKLSFKLHPGPLRVLADTAREKPPYPAHPHHRRNQPGQPRQSLRRAVLPARIPRRVDRPAVLPRQHLQPAEKPVPHRHHEHRRPVDRARRRGDAPTLRLRVHAPPPRTRARATAPLAGSTPRIRGRGSPTARRAQRPARRPGLRHRPVVPAEEEHLRAPRRPGTSLAD